MIFDRFDAVPEGEARVDVRLFSQGVLIAKRSGLSAMIVEGQTTSLGVMFGLGPAVHVLEPPLRASHLITSGRPIPVAVEMTDPDLPLELKVEANDVPVPVEIVDLRWLGQIDPTTVLRGAILPAIVEVHIDACSPGSDDLCDRVVRPVEIHRRLWSIDLMGARRASPPAADVALDRVVIGDDRGHLRIAKLSDGSLIADLALGSPIIRDLSILNGRVFAAAANGRAWIVSILDGAIAAGDVELGEVNPTGAGHDGTMFVIGAGKRLLRVSSSGAVNTLATFPDTLRATPLADSLGIIAVDVQGNVISFRANSAEEWRGNAGDLVYATPKRHDAGCWIATASGRLISFSGGRQIGTWELRGPVVHTPIQLGNEIVIAVGDRLAFFSTSGESIREQRFGSGITGAPADNGGGEVILGLADGRLVVTGRTTRILSRVGSTAYQPLVLGDRVLIAGSHGFLERLSTAEGP